VTAKNACSRPNLVGVPRVGINYVRRMDGGDGNRELSGKRGLTLPVLLMTRTTIDMTITELTTSSHGI
jgi:hypothetical protein